MRQHPGFDRRWPLAYLALSVAGCGGAPGSGRSGRRGAGRPGAGRRLGLGHPAPGTTAAPIQVALPGRALERGRPGERPDRAARFAPVRRGGSVRIGRGLGRGDRRPPALDRAARCGCQAGAELSAALGHVRCGAPARRGRFPERRRLTGTSTAWHYAGGADTVELCCGRREARAGLSPRFARPASSWVARKRRSTATALR